MKWIHEWLVEIVDSADVDVVADVHVIADENPTTVGVASNDGMMTDGIAD